MRFFWLLFLLVGAIAFILLRFSPGKVEVQSNLAPSHPESTNAAAESPATDSPLSLLVSVKDKETGLPIPGALLHLNRPQNGINQPTDFVLGPDGTTVILVTVPKADSTQSMMSCSVMISHPGHVPGYLTWYGPPKGTVPSGPAGWTILLPQGKRGGGFVVDMEGKPMPGIAVSFKGHGFSEPTGNWQPSQHVVINQAGAVVATTDSEGRWNLDDLPESMVSASLQVTIPNGGIRTYYTSDSGSIVSKEYSDSFRYEDVRDGKLVTRLPSGVTVRGIVTDSAGNPLVRIPMSKTPWNPTISQPTPSINAPRVSRAVLSELNPGSSQTPLNERSGMQFQTDAQGRFELPNQQGDQIRLTAFSESHGMASVEVPLSANTPEVHLVLPAARPLNIHFIHEDGSSPPSVNLLAQTGFSPSDPIIIANGDIDKEGHYRWTNAPAGPLRLTAVSLMQHVLRSWKIGADDRDIELLIPKNTPDSITLAGNAIDAETGQTIPVTAYIVTELPTGMSVWGPNIFSQSLVSRKFSGNPDFNITLPTDTTFPRYKVELTSSGYRPYLTATLLTGEGGWTNTFKMTRGQQPGAMILTPTGEPAAEARIIPSNPRGITFRDPTNSVLLTQQSGEFKTASDGTFDLSLGHVDSTLVIIHPSGFLALKGSDLLARPSVTLQAWGGIEGVYYSGKMIKPNSSLFLHADFSTPDPNSRSWAAAMVTSSDANGHFAFSLLPPGNYVLSESSNPVQSRNNPQFAQFVPFSEDGGLTSHPQFVPVRPGETVQLQVGGTGRKIVGKVIGDFRREPEFQFLVRKPISSDSPKPPRREEYPDARTFTAAWLPYPRLQPGMVTLDPAKYFPTFNTNGTFTIEDVPSGEYELHLHFRYNIALVPGTTTMFGFEPRRIVSEVREVGVPNDGNTEPLELKPIITKLD